MESVKAFTSIFENDKSSFSFYFKQFFIRFLIQGLSTISSKFWHITQATNLSVLSVTKSGLMILQVRSYLVTPNCYLFHVLTDVLFLFLFVFRNFSLRKMKIRLLFTIFSAGRTGTVVQATRWEALLIWLFSTYTIIYTIAIRHF